jgi:hypothetical protein
MNDTRRTRGIIAVTLLLLFAADVAATYAAFTSRVPGANDFYSRWEGAHAFWIDGLNPYSDEVTRRIQIGIYGRPARGDEDPGPFAYPFYTVFALWPLVGLPYAWVQAIWLSVLEFALAGIALMSLSLLRWRAGPLALAAAILFALFFYHGARAILLGQFAVVVAALVIGAFLAMRSDHDALAGVLLAFSTIKPQMIFLIVPYVLLWSVARRRWRVVGAFALSIAILFGLSFLMLPTWLGDFLRQLGNYTSYTSIGSPVWVIVQYYLGLGDLGEAIVSGAIGLALIGVWAWTTRLVYVPAVAPDELARDVSYGWGTFQWVCGLTLIASNLIALRTATTNYVILYPALWLVARAIVDRSPQWGRWIVTAGAVALLIGLWALFAATVVGKQEHPLVYLPLPVGLAAAFAAGRRALIDSAGQGA